jgi:hypothetical protein
MAMNAGEIAVTAQVYLQGVDGAMGQAVRRMDLVEKGLHKRSLSLDSLPWRERK